MDDPKRDTLDDRIQSDLAEWLDEIPVTGQDEGWERIEEALYADDPKASPPGRNRKRWGVAVALALVIGLVVFQGPRIYAWGHWVVQDFTVTASDSLNNIVGWVQPRRDATSQGSQPTLESDDQTTLSTLSADLPYTPWVWTGDTRTWELDDVQFDAASGTPRLMLHYRNGEDDLITITEDAIDHQMSWSLAYDEDDAERSEHQIRGTTVNVITYKNGMIRAWWQEGNIFFMVTGTAKTGSVSTDEALVFIRGLGPFSP